MAEVLAVVLAVVLAKVLAVVLAVVLGVDLVIELVALSVDVMIEVLIHVYIQLVFIFRLHAVIYYVFYYVLIIILLYTGDHWGTTGSGEVQPDTAERLRETPQFEADHPATSTTAEFAAYREYTTDIAVLPLPCTSGRTRAMCEKHHPVVVQHYRQMTDDVCRRVASAREQIARKKGKNTVLLGFNVIFVAFR